MKNIELGKLSNVYDVRRLCIDDVEMIRTLCKDNPQYYEYRGKEISVELIESDINITPPGIPMERKYYIGFFEKGMLTAVMDLIDGYPDDNCGFIGFFMMNRQLQGAGIGSRIVSEVLDHLRERGFKRCQLGIDKGNPQSYHFWRKNGFEVIRESAAEEGVVLVAERVL